MNRLAVFSQDITVTDHKMINCASFKYRFISFFLIVFLTLVSSSVKANAAVLPDLSKMKIKMQQDWQSPVNLPSPVNLRGWEDGVSVDPNNGSKIYFAYISLDIQSYVTDLLHEYDKDNPNATYPDPEKFKENYVIGPERNNNFGVRNSNIYEATKNDNNSWDVKALPAPINGDTNGTVSEEHSPSISADGHRLYFTKQTVGTNEDIYMSEKNLSTNSWSIPTKVPNINYQDPNYNDGNANISFNGKTIIFDSDRPGGKGNRDLYYSLKSDKGWSKPKALTQLNSNNNDWQPFLTKDGKIIYFTSDRTSDRSSIYKSERLGGGWDKWSKPQLVVSAFESTTIAGVGEPSVSSDGRMLYFLYVYQKEDGSFESNIAVSTSYLPKPSIIEPQQTTNTSDNSFIQVVGATTLYPNPTSYWSSKPGAWNWNATKLARGDFDGDGTDDIMALYGYKTKREVKAYFFKGNAGGGFNAPKIWWDSGAGNWDLEGSMLTSGDYNGDGIWDLGILYGYQKQRDVKAFILPSDGSKLTGAQEWWHAGAGNWDWSGSMLKSGDFNGDGLSDFIILYGYATQRAVTAFVLPSKGSSFSAAEAWWKAGTGNWDWSASKLTVGDYTGDGRDDLAILYGYATQRDVTAFVLPSKGSSFSAAKAWWQAGAGNWDWSGSTITSGDYTGNGRDDLAIFYSYSGARSAIFVFPSTGKTLSTVTKYYDSGPGGWNGAATKVLSGNFDGSGKDELAGLYKQTENQTTIYSFRN